MTGKQRRSVDCLYPSMGRGTGFAGPQAQRPPRAMTHKQRRGVDCLYASMGRGTGFAGP